MRVLRDRLSGSHEEYAFCGFLGVTAGLWAFLRGSERREWGIHYAVSWLGIISRRAYVCVCARGWRWAFAASIYCFDVCVCAWWWAADGFSGFFFFLGDAPWGPPPEFFAYSCLSLLKKARFMKFSQSIFSLAVLVLMALCLSASESGILVSNVKAVPRWPWDGKVDIFYVVECDDADAELTLTFSGYDGDKDEWVTMRKGHLSGDGVDTALEFGKEQHAVWNAGEDIPGFHCSAFTVKINASSAGNADYLVVSLSDTGVCNYRYTNDAPDLTDDTCRTSELWLRRIPAGTFTMGSPSGETGRNSNETQHQVTISEDFYIGVFECTQKQYDLICGEESALESKHGDTRPIEGVSFAELRGSSATAGAGWPAYGHKVDDDSFLGTLRKRTELCFDLPTEAQWEYACRLKSDGSAYTTALNSGKNLTSASKCANMAEVGRYGYNSNNDFYGSNSDGKGGYDEHTAVGSYAASGLGLYDMHGNVAEWCLDWYQADLGGSAVSDPVGATSSSDGRVIRSGCWALPASYCRAAFRMAYSVENGGTDGALGFRVVCLPGVSAE
jgi:formylglycine-generating enzyme required for sulfatase activity